MKLISLGLPYLPRLYLLPPTLPIFLHQAEMELNPNHLRARAHTHTHTHIIKDYDTCLQYILRKQFRRHLPAHFSNGTSMSSFAPHSITTSRIPLVLAGLDDHGAPQAPSHSKVQYGMTMVLLELGSGWKY